MVCLSVIYICSLIFISSSVSVADNKGILDKVDDVKLVLVGMRHANRNPGKFLPHDPNKGDWGPEGPNQLNSFGYEQALATGEALRDRYEDFIPERFNSSETLAKSSNADRCQHTMDLVLTGLYPPLKGYHVDFQPVSIFLDVPMLRMYSENRCQPQLDAWEPIDDMTLEPIATLMAENKVEVAYISNVTGFPATLSGMADVADNILNMEHLDLDLPKWVEEPELEGYDAESWLEKILSFSEGPQIACANYVPCRDIMAGYWLNDLLTRLQDKAKGKDPGHKLVIYTSHTEITLSLMKLMSMNYNECPTSAGFIIELKNDPTPSVRLIYHEPDEEDNDERHLELAHMTESSGLQPDEDGWLPLEDFVNCVKGGADPDWKAVCDIECL